jgi:outer membrane protein
VSRGAVLSAVLLVVLPVRPAVAEFAAPAQEATASELPASALSLTLAEALSLARARSARLAQLSALQVAADASLRGARAERLPRLDLSASYERYSNVPELSITTPTGPRTVYPNLPDNYGVRAGLSMPLYTGGRIENGIGAADERRAASAKDLEGGIADLVLETTTAYWTLVTARENERVLREAIASFDAHLKDATNRQEVGMAARNEVLSVQVQRDSAELARLQAANAAEAANANLLRLVDGAPGSRFEPSEPLTGPPVASEEIEALVAQASQARPEIAALRSRAASLDASAKVAHSTSLPQANIEAGYDFTNPNRRIVPWTARWEDTWTVGINVSIAAFDGGRASAATAQAQAQAEAARHQLEDLERQVRLEVTSRALDLASARAAIGVAERNVESARENVRVSQDSYREGVIPSSELLDAETALLRAGLDRTSALAQLRIAAAGLDRAVGR